jgi:hypothetical protein
VARGDGSGDGGVVAAAILGHYHIGGLVRHHVQLLKRKDWGFTGFGIVLRSGLDYLKTDRMTMYIKVDGNMVQKLMASRAGNCTHAVVLANSNTQPAGTNPCFPFIISYPLL